VDHPDAAHEELWRGILTGNPPVMQHDRNRFRRIPGSPRWKSCLFPLGGPVAWMLRLRTHRGPSRKNPNYCNLCEEFVRTHPGGAEIDISLLFADVRGSTSIAERIGSASFTALMNRFFRAGTDVLIDGDALIDKFVGDQVIGLFLPAMVTEHPRAAIEAGRRLLESTGHAGGTEPWLPIGIGVHSGTAFVGSVGEGAVADLTAMGDAVNVAARLSSAAAPGELLVSVDTWTRSGLSGSPPRRVLELKGRDRPIEVGVLGEDRHEMRVKEMRAKEMRAGQDSNLRPED
jgi:adenylate cyclase